MSVSSIFPTKTQLEEPGRTHTNQEPTWTGFTVMMHPTGHQPTKANQLPHTFGTFIPDPTEEPEPTPAPTHTPMQNFTPTKPTPTTPTTPTPTPKNPTTTQYALAIGAGVAAGLTILYLAHKITKN